MTEVLFTRSPHRVSSGVAAATLVVLVLVGIVGVSLPLRCTLGLFWGGGICSETLGNVAENAPSQAPAKPRPVPAAKPAAVMPSAIEPAALPADAAASNLVDATFQTLHVSSTSTAEPNNANSNSGLSVVAASTVAARVAPSAPTTRLVTTTVIHPDASPQPVPLAPALPGTVANVSPAQATQVPLTSRMPLAAGTPAGSPAQVVTPVASESPVTTPVPGSSDIVVPADKPPALEKVASTGVPVSKTDAPSSGTLVVGGSGVTVRSGPSRSKAELFALAPGQKVTVAGKERGWLHVTDTRGRAGWIYSSYLTTPKK